MFVDSRNTTEVISLKSKGRNTNNASKLKMGSLSKSRFSSIPESNLKTRNSCIPKKKIDISNSAKIMLPRSTKNYEVTTAIALMLIVLYRKL
jgi:hypothetical protein